MKSSTGAYGTAQCNATRFIRSAANDSTDTGDCEYEPESGLEPKVKHAQPSSEYTSRLSYMYILQIDTSPARQPDRLMNPSARFTDLTSILAEAGSVFLLATDAIKLLYYRHELWASARPRNNREAAT